VLDRGDGRELLARRSGAGGAVRCALAPHALGRHVGAPNRRSRVRCRGPVRVALLAPGLDAPRLGRGPGPRMSLATVGNVRAMRPAWEPNESYLERSRLRRFARANGYSEYAAFLDW